MADGVEAICARLPGEWFVGDQFQRGGYQWAITKVVAADQDCTTFEAQTLYPLDRAES